MPTSVVQGDGLCKLLEKLESRYQLPSQKTLSGRVIPTMYNSIKDSKVLPGIREANIFFLPVIAGQVESTKATSVLLHTS